MDEIDMKKICLDLIDDVKITPIYDSSKNITTFTFTFPTWLKKKYSNETVKVIINTITPVLIQVMNETTNKECFQVIKENV